MTSVYLYPSLCFFEGTPVSVGRGTRFPFKAYGHPGMKGRSFGFTPRSMPGAQNPPQKDCACAGVYLGKMPEEKLLSGEVNLEYLIDAYRDLKDDPDFIEHHKEDLAASLEHTIVEILMKKLRQAAKDTGIKEVAVAGGVSANNGLRNAFREHAAKYGWKIFIPKFSYTTDNAAMIAITGYFKYLDQDFCGIDLPAYSRVTLK